MIKRLLKFKKLYNHYLDKRSEIVQDTQFQVENFFGNFFLKRGFFARTNNLI